MKLRHSIAATLTLLAGLAGLAGGSALAEWWADQPPSLSLRAGDTPWMTSLELGDGRAGPLLRARLSQFGLLALTREESVYFLARTDSSGRPLSRTGEYAVVGSVPESAWWSLTAYGPDYQLLPSETRRYSVASGANCGATSLEVGLGGDPEDDIELRGSGPFLLTLRLYGPPDWDAAEIERLSLPAIRRLDL